MNLPALRVLRESYPKSWITLFLDEKVAPLLEAQPEKDEIMRISGDQFASDAEYRAKILRDVRVAHFDLAVISNASKHLHWMAFKAGIPVRVGYCRKWGFLLNKTLSDDKKEVLRHEIDSNLKLVSLCSDAKWDGIFTLNVQEAAGAVIIKRLDVAKLLGKKLAVIHAGTSNEKKRWPLEKFVEICRWLHNEKKLSVVLVGGEEEMSLSAELVQRAGVPMTDWTGRIGLQELSAFFHSTDVTFLLSVDSGPVHVAWMSGAPVVVLYAADVPGSNPGRWGPRSSRSQIIFKPIKEIESNCVIEKIEKVLA